MSTRTIVWALPLGLSLAFAACASDEPDTQTGPNNVVPIGGVGGTQAGAAAGGATGAGASPGGVTGGSSPGGVTGGSSPGGVTGGSSPGGVTGGSSPGGVTGGSSPGGVTGGASPGGMTGGGMTGGAMTGGGMTGGGMTGGGSNNFVKCDPKAAEGVGDKPCGTFVTNNGVTLDLGPYGGQMQSNVGMGFETTVNTLLDNDVACGLFIAGFAEDPEASARLNDTSKIKLELHTIYRPVNLPPGKMPIVTWGNGTCAMPEGYGALLRYLASHGFFVVAANNRYVGSGDPQKKALDFAFAMNMDMTSPFYQKLDTDKVIAMGHSQGGMGTAAAASDPRIKAVILFNGGTSASKPFFAISGDMDIGSGIETYKSAVSGTSQPKAAWMWFHMVPATGSVSGHVTLMTQPERVAPATLAWAKYILLDDAESKTYFAGASCKLCNMAAQFEFGQKGIQ